MSCAVSPRLGTWTGSAEDFHLDSYDPNDCHGAWESKAKKLSARTSFQSAERRWQCLGLQMSPRTCQVTALKTRGGSAVQWLTLTLTSSATMDRLPASVQFVRNSARPQLSSQIKACDYPLNLSAGKPLA